MSIRKLIFRAVVLGLTFLFVGCFHSYEDIDFVKSVAEADKIFEAHDIENGELLELPEDAVYLASLKPERAYINSEKLSLTLHRSGVEASGIVILRDGHEISEIDLKGGSGTDHQKLFDRVYRWENRG